MNNSLSAVHPELIVEWSKKNLPLTPDGITFGSNKVVWWKGSCGHEWQTSVKARSKGEKCPICSGARAVAGINDLSTLKPELASEWSKKNEIKPTEVTVGSHKKVIWKCRLGHEWTASVKSRSINGSGCPYCSHNKVLVGFNDLATVVPKVADEWSEKNEKKPTEVTAFANRKAWWKCRTCGYEWNTFISTRSGGSKCPCCSGYTFIKGRNDLKTTHPEIAEEWSEKNYPLQPDEVNAKSRKNVWWHCKKCGNEWKSVINARIKGTACPVCAEREVLAGYNDLATTDKNLLREWDYELNRIQPTEVSRTSAKRAWWKCRHGHSWSVKINERTRLTNMIKSGKELKVFSIPNKDLKKFTEQAKRYGVLYCVLRDKNTKGDNVPIDIIARAEDASKIQRIVERFELGKVDKAAIVTESQKAVEKREALEKEKPAKSKNEIITEEAVRKPLQKIKKVMYTDGR